MSLLRSATVAGSALLLLGAAVATAASADAATTPRCTAATTTLTGAFVPGAANTHFGVRLHVTNSSRTACVVNGYPTVTLRDSRGTAVLTAARTPTGHLGGAAPVRTVLAPGAQATALLEGVVSPDPDSPTYAQATRLSLRLPNATGTDTVALLVPRDPHLEVHGLIAGSTGVARS